MDRTENFIIDNIRFVYEKFGMFGILFAIIVVAMAYLVFEVIRAYSSKAIKRVIVGEDDVPDISNSILFHKMDMMINFRINKLKISCPLRYRIFTDIIRIKIRKKLNAFKEIKNEDVISLDNTEFRDFWESKILQIDQETVEEWSKTTIPEIAIRKYQDFCQDSSEAIVGFVNDVCNSNRIYVNNIEKSVAILDFIAGISDMSLIAAEKAVSHINGELSKKEYLGIKCNENCVVVGCEHRGVKNV